MAGRGRGRGGGGNKALIEQLGLQKNELIKEPSTGPPEIFPSLQFRPVALPRERSEASKYFLMVKKELRAHLQSAECTITLDSKKPDIERYSDRFHCLTGRSCLSLPWARFPRELRPPGAQKGLSSQRQQEKKRKREDRSDTPAAKKHAPDVDVVKKLEQLEKKEKGGGDEAETEEERNQVEEVQEEEEDVDEEMDEGTDYINSYFDNGEAYIEDDGDPLEEGGVF